MRGAGQDVVLQQRFGARVVMSADDWEWLANDPGRWPIAKRDIVATDGYELTLGDTTLMPHLTPGHTPGTEIAAKAGADVILSNHPQYDRSTRKLALMAKRTVPIGGIK